MQKLVSERPEDTFTLDEVRDSGTWIYLLFEKDSEDVHLLELKEGYYCWKRLGRYDFWGEECASIWDAVKYASEENGGDIYRISGIELYRRLSK